MASIVTAPRRILRKGRAQRVFTLRLLTTFAGVALTLAALGLFGVLSYGVRLRSREFGIPMALGADRGSIRRMVMREGLTVTAIGTLLGLLGAVALSRVMASMVFGVSALDPTVLAGAAIVMAVVAHSLHTCQRTGPRQWSRVPCFSKKESGGRSGRDRRTPAAGTFFYP